MLPLRRPSFRQLPINSVSRFSALHERKFDALEANPIIVNTIRNIWIFQTRLNPEPVNNTKVAASLRHLVANLGRSSWTIDPFITRYSSNSPNHISGSWNRSRCNFLHKNIAIYMEWSQISHLFQCTSFILLQFRITGFWEIAFVSNISICIILVNLSVCLSCNVDCL